MRYIYKFKKKENLKISFQEHITKILINCYYVILLLVFMDLINLMRILNYNIYKIIINKYIMQNSFSNNNKIYLKKNVIKIFLNYMKIKKI